MFQDHIAYLRITANLGSLTCMHDADRESSKCSEQLSIMSKVPELAGEGTLKMSERQTIQHFSTQGTDFQYKKKFAKDIFADRIVV
jgi:hypothetical protein